ncbi:GTP-binding protein, partial [Fischerella thermalis]
TVDNLNSSLYYATPLFYMHKIPVTVITGFLGAGKTTLTFLAGSPQVESSKGMKLGQDLVIQTENLAA